MNFSVQLREQTGKESNRKLRQNGLTPGIIYGISEPQPVSMDAYKALRFIRSMKGATNVVNLVIESDGKADEKKVIIQDYQTSNVGDKLLHADFLEVTDDSIVSMDVPIHVINDEDCPAVKTGGVLQIIRRTVPVRCKVKNIQDYIVVDLKDLEFGDSVHVLDLEYGEGVKPIVTGRNFTIITVAGRSVDEEAEEEGDELDEAAATDDKPEAAAAAE